MPIPSAVALDTCSLIYAFDNTDPADEFYGAGRRVVAFLDKQAEAEIPVIIPPQVLAEFLVKRTETERQAIVDEFSASYVVEPFGITAAIEFARIRAEKGDFKSALAKHPEGRQAITVDAIIAASALSAGAKLIVTSNDRDFKTLTGGRLKVQSIEDLPDPIPPAPAPASPSLFDSIGDEPQDSA